MNTGNLEDKSLTTVITESNFVRFRTDYAYQDRRCMFGSIYLRGSVVKINADGGVFITCVDQRLEKPAPPVAKPNLDVPHTRQDTLWGDLKLASIKISEDMSKHVDSFNKTQGGLKGVFFRTNIYGLSENQVNKLKVGEQYYFELSPPIRKQSIREMVNFQVISFLSEEAPEAVPYEEWLSNVDRYIKANQPRENRIAALLRLSIIPAFIVCFMLAIPKCSTPGPIQSPVKSEQVNGDPDIALANTVKPYVDKCNQKDPLACLSGGTILEKNNEFILAASLYGYGCGLKNSEACNSAARLKDENGDHQAAKGFLRKACSFGNLTSCEKLKALVR